jgi:inositol-phosphate transport system permease protein
VRRFGAPLLFLLPASVLILLFFIIPVFVTIALSLTDLSTATIRNPSWVGFDNYLRLFSDPFIPKILGNTARYVILTLTFNVVMGLVLAILTSLIPERWGDNFRSLWLLPRILPPVVYVFVWQGIMARAPFGIISEITGVNQSWINAAPWTTIILANGFVGASFGMLIFTSAIRAIPRELFYSAAVDGAGTLQTVRRVVLPLLRWPILFVTVYQTLSLLTSFDYILLLTNGGPGLFKTTVWSLHAYKLALSNYFGQIEFGLAAALATFLVIIGVLVSVVYMRIFNFNALVSQPKIEVN